VIAEEEIGVKNGTKVRNADVDCLRVISSILSLERYSTGFANNSPRIGPGR